MQNDPQFLLVQPLSQHIECHLAAELPSMARAAIAATSPDMTKNSPFNRPIILGELH
jgi:hypothetical protein